jgi:hypothetical protein
MEPIVFRLWCGCHSILITGCDWTVSIREILLAVFLLSEEMDGCYVKGVLSLSVISL